MPRITPGLHAVVATCFLCVTSKSLVTELGNKLQLCGTWRHAVDLSFHNFTDVPTGLPADTEYLDLSHNDISRLKDDGLAGYPHLCHLNLSHNKIQHISPSAFAQSTIIKVLIISHNSLLTIPDIILPQLRILDISSNLYSRYRLGNSFRNLTNLTFLALGSPSVSGIEVEDFAALRNSSLTQLSFSESPKLQQYEAGSLAQIKTLQEVTLTMSFCQKFGLFKTIVLDLNKTEATVLRLVRFLPQNCNISSDPFEGFKEIQFLKNLTFVDTWFNSSVISLLLENIFLSPIEELAFVNIAYNEDTPDGAHFYPKCNRTAGLRSVIFNRVQHYQYSYPKINMSVTWLSQMTYLKFSGTGMNISPCNLISAMPALVTLDLSDNLLNDDGFWWPGCSYTKAFPVLKYLSLSHNRFVYLSFIAEKTHQMKALESLDLSFNSIQLDKECSWPLHLVELSLSNNNLGNNVFSYLSPHFRRINLSKTGITTLTQEALSSFLSLTHLFLSSNDIQILPADLQVPSMLELHVGHNAITSISQSSILGLPRLYSLKAGYNPFSCSCDSYWFVTALNKSLLPDWPMSYTCAAPPSFVGIPLEKYKPTKPLCLPWLQAAIAIPVLLVLTATLGIIFRACDGMWYATMLWVWIRVKRRSRMRARQLQNASFRYHAFISYSQHDSEWVQAQLVPKLETSGLSLCVHERDFVPGQWIVDNIISCVEDSYKTLFVLSQNFVRSEWCNYELFFAQHRTISIQEDSLVFILLEPIPADSLPRKFMKLRTLLREQTYLEWPEDKRKQQIFWTSLRAMLQTADKNVVLWEVATDIVDTLPLLAQRE